MTTFERRDGLTGLVLGGFLAVLALLVLAGLPFAETGIDRLINLISGLALLLAGGGFVLAGRRHLRRAGRDAP